MKGRTDPLWRLNCLKFRSSQFRGHRNERARNGDLRDRRFCRTTSPIASPANAASTCCRFCSRSARSSPTTRIWRRRSRIVLKVMQQRLKMQRGHGDPLRPRIQTIFIHESFGLQDEQKTQRHLFAGEGITGKVVESGKAMIAPQRRNAAGRRARAADQDDGVPPMPLFSACRSFTRRKCWAPSAPSGSIEPASPQAGRRTAGDHRLDDRAGGRTVSAGKYRQGAAGEREPPSAATR